MTRTSRQHFLLFIVITTLIGITYSHENDTSTEVRRHGRVNGRIVKLYSGPKPDPILCQREGFLADAVDCSVFYRCLKASNGKYSVYRFQCGPGTVYDPDTEICNHPRSTKRSLCGGVNSDRVFSSTQRYIENEIEGLQKEIEELPSPIKTKPSKVNNAILNTIATSKPAKLESSYTTNIYPWVTTSKYEYNVALAGSSLNIPASPSSGKPWGYTPTRGSTYVTPRPIKQNGVQCTSDGFMGDSEDCRKFYRCVNNQRGGYLKYEFSCSESTIWDDDTQGCNHPWAVQRRRCGKGNSYSENTITYVDDIKANEVAPDQFVQQQTQISYGSKVTQIQTQISKGPVTQNQTQINFGDRINQEKLNEIQHPENYGAAVSQVQSQVNYGNEALQTQLQVDNSSQSQTTLSSTAIPTSTLYIKHSSTNKCMKAGFVGDSNDCKKFYRCVSNEKGGFTVHEFSCSDGTLWDEDLEACNHAWAVKCGEKRSNQNKSSPATMIENTTVKDFITTASPFYNNEINDIGYINQNGQQEKEQPESITKITLLTTITTESPKLYEGDCKSSGYFGYAYDCAKFYRCVEDGSGRFKKYEYKCGDGTVWDPQIESCNHVWSVKSCTNNSTRGDQKQSSVAPSSTDNTIITTVSLIQTTTQKYIHDYDSGYGSLNREPPLQSTTVRDHIANQENDCINPGFMGDNKDCKMFYRCVENGQGGFTRHKFTCGEGTVWDSDLGACNHAWAVEKCGGGAIKDSQESTSPPSISGNNSEKDDNYNTNQDIDKDTENTKSSTSSAIINSASPITNGQHECQSNGFMGNDNDCKIFYRCVENGNGGFIRYEFACGDGTVWDPKIAACNHVWAVERCGGSISVVDSNYTTASTVSETSTQYTTSTTGFTTLTSTVSEVDNVCKGNGFIGDNKDCKKFYRCVEDEKGSYTRYEFACGEGTLWDSKIEACNHAWAVTSCGYNISPGSEHISTHSPTTMKDEEIANNTVAQSNQEISSSTEHNSASSSTIKSSTTVNDVIQCNIDGFMGDTTDCRKFYRCVNDGNGNFLRYEFTCSDGTVWDSEINACNHVNSVKTPCTSISTQTTKDNEPNYIDSSTSNTNDYATTSKSPPKNPECQQEGFFGDKTDCKKFYRCIDNGQGGFHKYEFSCGEGTLWDQQILACNHATTTSLCGSAVKEPQLDNSDSQSTLTTSTTQSTEKIQTSTTLQNECKSDGFYANPNDCKKFYRCVGDGKDGYIKYDFSCGEGTVWVQDIQACDHDNDHSFCSKDKNTTITNGQSNETNPVTTTTTSIASSTIDTATSKPNTKPTMQDETLSGSSSTTETTSTSSSTLASTGNKDHCDEAGYFGNSQDCNMFYRCVDNGKGGFTKYDFTCGDGTIWDQDITACNHPQDVLNPSCYNEVSSSHTTMTTKTTTTTSTTTKSTEASEPTKGTSTTETSTAESSNQEMSTKKPSNTNYTCTQAGFYADPYDCKKFYRCVDWANDGKTFSIYHFDCGEGTIWDPELQTCNHEQSVYPPRDCSGKQPQNENNNGTTTTTKQDETTESSTTEMTTTTLQSTTEKSTSLASTTATESSSTTDQTSTQQSSTSEQASSTSQSSTQSSSSEQSTTQESTTEQSTTQQSTTASDQTTQASSTQQSSTSEQTTTTTTEQTTTTTTDQTSTTTPEQTTTTTTEQTSTTTPEQTTTTTTEQTTTTTEQTTTSPNEETTTTAQTTTTESTTSTTDQTTKADQTTTQESSTEQSSENQSSTTEQTTTQETSTAGSTTESGQETSTEQGASDKECPHTDNDQYLFVCPTGFRRHPKYCNLFYQCTEDDDSHEMKVAVFNCPNNTIYDESKTQCVEEEKADKKCDGEIAQRRRVKRLDTNYKEPITVGRQKYTCPALGHFPFEKNEECSPVLFKCEVSKSGKIRGLLYQCPQGYVYWSISRRCEPVSIMTGCKRSLMNWSGRYEIPVERNNVSRKIIK